MTDRYKESAILIDVECLADLRAGAMITLSPEFAFEVTNRPEYYVREFDEFKVGTDRIDLAFIDKVIAADPIKVFLNSPATKAFLFLRDWCAERLVAGATKRLHEKVEIIVNMGRFHLPAEMEEEYIKRIVAITGGLYSIRLVNWSIQDLTPALVRSNFGTWLCYNPLKWWETHSYMFRQKPMLTELQLYIPKMNMGRPLTKEEIKMFADEKQDPYLKIRKAFMPHFLLTWIDVDVVCMIHPNSVPRA